MRSVREGKVRYVAVLVGEELCNERLRPVLERGEGRVRRLLGVGVRVRVGVGEGIGLGSGLGLELELGSGLGLGLGLGLGIV